MHRTLCLVALALLLCVGPAAAGEPSAADKDTARTLVQEGRKLMDAGNHKAALEKFSAAHKIMRVPSTGYDVARAQAKVGLLVEAHDMARSVTLIPAEPKEPEAFEWARGEARKLMESLEPRIPMLVIQVLGAPAGAELVVEVDGAAIPAAALDLPRKVNPGDHRVVAKAPGLQGERTVRVAEGKQLKVEVQLGASQGGYPAGPPGPGGPPPGYAPYQPGFGYGGYGAAPPPPKELDYVEGQDIPDGYAKDTKIRKGLVIGGAVTFGAMYLITVLTGALISSVEDLGGGDGSGVWPVYVPVVGPFIGMGMFDAEAAGMAMLALSGVAQAGGVAMFIAGLAAPKTVLVRTAAVELTVVPAVGRAQQGLGVIGRF